MPSDLIGGCGRKTARKILKKKESLRVVSCLPPIDAQISPRHPPGVLFLAASLFGW
ncbi:hypothetical protein MnTg02_02343 [bacterium MnTg02]|nr:hypothetical protein MnTg02_02343 [bacterium MnTg02]